MKKTTDAPTLKSTERGVEDLESWYEYRKQVTPLEAKHRQRTYAETPCVSAQPRREKEYVIPASSTLFDWESTASTSLHSMESDSYRWSRHPAGRAQWRRWLAQQPEYSIDLHGHTLESSFQALSHCLHVAQRNHYRVILCVHGKGLSTPQGESVLRRAVREWLTCCPFVIAYSAAPEYRGGDGATVIWLRAWS